MPWRDSVPHLPTGSQEHELERRVMSGKSALHRPVSAAQNVYGGYNMNGAAHTLIPEQQLLFAAQQ